MAKAKGGGSEKGGGNGSEVVAILREIWNEMKALNKRVDTLNDRVDTTNERLDAVRTEVKAEIARTSGELRSELAASRAELREDLASSHAEVGRRVTASELRLANATTQLAGDVQQLSGLIREWRDDHRAERAELRARV